MEIQQSLQFPHAYEYKILDEIPSKISNNFHIPPSLGSEKVGAGAGLMLKIIPEGAEPWLCTVDATMRGQFYSGVHSAPDPNKMCVVMDGNGYLFSVIDPKNCEQIKCTPILDMREVPSRGALIFVDFTEMWAYDFRGLKWVTRRLALDGIVIKEITATHAKVECDNEGMGNGKKIVAVDLETGEDEGGIGELGTLGKSTYWCRSKDGETGTANVF